MEPCKTNVTLQHFYQSASREASLKSIGCYFHLVLISFYIAPETFFSLHTPQISIVQNVYKIITNAVLLFIFPL